MGGGVNRVCVTVGEEEGGKRESVCEGGRRRREGRKRM